MSAGTWVLERCEGERFPYRVQVLDPSGRPVLRLRAQDRWPAANQNIFCLREDATTGDAFPGEEIERVDVVALQRRGVRLSVVLDRPRYKRCDFLFLKRSYKNRPDESYEQIFWQTQTSMLQRRPKIAPPTLRSRAQLTVAIDARERYPWRFAGSTVVRKRLDSGDYALLDGDQPVAIVERKTFENMLADFGVMPLLHQRLMELSAHEHHALVIEAPYESFLDRGKLHHYSPAFCAAVIADLYVAHPRLRIVFCANRKAANAWTASYFAAVWAKLKDSSTGAHAYAPRKRMAED
jgi:ERCC4 domain-containing protein